MFKLLALFLGKLFKQIFEEILKFVWNFLNLSNLKYENDVEKFAIKCHDQKDLFRYKMILLMSLLFYNTFHRLFLVLLAEKFNAQDSFAFYNHHMMIFNSKDQDILSMVIFLVMLLVYMKMCYNPDKYLIQVFLTIYHRKSFENVNSRKFEFLKYFQRKALWRKFKYLNPMVGGSFGIASRLEIILWPFIARKLYSFLHENTFDFGNEILLWLKFSIFSILYHVGFYLLGETTKYTTTIHLFFLYFIKKFFQVLFTKFKNPLSNLELLRKEYLIGLNIFFHFNCCWGYVLLYSVFLGTPLHAFFVIQILYDKSYSIIFSMASLSIISTYVFLLQFFSSRVTLSINRVYKAIHSKLILIVFNAELSKICILRSEFTFASFLTIINNAYFFTYGKYGSITFISFQKFFFIYIKFVFMLYKIFDYVENHENW